MKFFNQRSNDSLRKLRAAMSALLLIAFIPSAFGQVPLPAPGAPAPTPAATPAAAAVAPIPAPTIVPPPATPAPSGPAAPVAFTARPDRATGTGLRLKHRNSPVDLLLADYGERTGLTLLLAPGLPKANVTLESQSDLTLEEYLQAIEKVLGMNGISLVRDGDKFLKVVAIGQTRVEGDVKIRIEASGDSLLPTGELVSQMIVLKHITVTDAQQAITALKHPYAQVQAFDRSNAILLTDTSANVKRVLEMIGYIDQPMESREQPNIRQIKYSQASLIKAKLEEVIASAQDDATKTAPKAKQTGPPGLETVSSTPTAPSGVIRATARITPSGGITTAPAADEANVAEMAERGIVQGKVKIIADDRTNLLILITRIENMVFFDRIITVLDVETAPDVAVQVVRLEYAEAEQVASTLNSLIGGVEKPKDSTQAPTDKGTADKSADLKQYAEQLRNEAAAASAAKAAAAGGANTDLKSKIGQLSAQNIKVLADKRTNSLLIMASKADFATLQDMIKSMDIMLSQVALDVVIFKINLNNANERGVDWVQRAMMTSSDSGDPLFAFAGAGGGDKNRSNLKDPTTMTSVSSLSSSSGNLAYYFTFFDLNLDAIIKMIASDSRSQIVSSPKIITTDNKVATINVTTEKYFFKGLKFVSTSGSGAGEWVDDVEMKKVGIKLTFTPRINQKKFVVLEIQQSIEGDGPKQQISGAGGATLWPTIYAAELTASVAVRSDETIVLGGMQSNTKERSHSKIPFLGDLPLLGELFSYTTESDERSELVVFITPRVLDTPEEVAKNATQIKNAVGVGELWPRGWSDSKMADPTRRELYQKQQEEKERTRLERKAIKLKTQQEKEEARVKVELEKKEAEATARAAAMKTPLPDPAQEPKQPLPAPQAERIPETAPAAVAPTTIPSVPGPTVTPAVPETTVETAGPVPEAASTKPAPPDASTRDFIQGQEERWRMENVSQPKPDASKTSP